VYYRQSCATQAAALGVSGWVRNLSDGRVEAVFEGSPDSVGAMVEWCRTGPRYAAVDGVLVRAEPAEGTTTFSIRG